MPYKLIAVCDDCGKEFEQTPTSLAWGLTKPTPFTCSECFLEFARELESRREEEPKP